MEAIVKMKMLTLYLFPVSSRSVSIEVTDAELIIPESRRLREQRMPAIVQSLRSILRRSRFSNSLVDALVSSLSDSMDCASSDMGVVLSSSKYLGGVNDDVDD